MSRKKKDRKKVMMGTMVYEDSAERIKDLAAQASITASLWISELIERELIKLNENKADTPQAIESNNININDYTIDADLPEEGTTDKQIETIVGKPKLALHKLFFYKGQPTSIKALMKIKKKTEEEIRETLRSEGHDA